MAIYPFVEQWVTGDKSEHHILDRPRNAPTRTAFGVAAMTCYAMLWIGGGNDLVATQFNVSLNAVTYFLRVAVFVGSGARVPASPSGSASGCSAPTRSGCCTAPRPASSSGIRPAGTPSGTARSARSEAYTLTQHKEHLPLLAASARPTACRTRRSRPSSVAGAATRFYFIDALRKPTRAELEEAAEHQAHGNGHGTNGHDTNGHGDHEVEGGDQAAIESGESTTPSGTASH